MQLLSCEKLVDKIVAAHKKTGSGAPSKGKS